MEELKNSLEKPITRTLLMVVSILLFTLANWEKLSRFLTPIVVITGFIVVLGGFLILIEWLWEELVVPAVVTLVRLVVSVLQILAFVIGVIGLLLLLLEVAPPESQSSASLPAFPSISPQTLPTLLLTLPVASSEVSPTTPPVDSERQLIIIYPQQDGVTLRAGPNSSFRDITTLVQGTELTVNGKPVRSKEDHLKWWPVSSPYGEGWVAEFVGNRRLIKPIISSGEIVVVAYLLGDGKVKLRDENFDTIIELQRGTELMVIDGPQIKFDAPTSLIVQEGRRWWYVTTVDRAVEGWIAEFGEKTKAMLIAPKWYVELSRQVPPP